MSRILLLTGHSSYSIILARPCILWPLIIPPASPLAFGPICSASLFNCLQSPRCPPLSSLPHHSCHTQLPIHPSEVTLSGTLSYLPISQEDWIRGCRWNTHTDTRLGPTGDDTPGKLPFNSPHPTVHTQECAGCHWRLTLGGQAGKGQRHANCQEGTGCP